MADVFVTRLDEAAGRRLYDALGREAFQFRQVPHARFSAQGLEATVTLYASGKLVVQGRGTGAFLARFLPDRAAADPAPEHGDATQPLDRPTVGSDESGKGDYFGPLVVAAALVRPDQVPGLKALGVQDSKLVADGRARKLEGALAHLVPHAVRVLEPETYNAVYAGIGNVNKLLGRLHAEVIDELMAAVDRPEEHRIVVDRFGDPQHVRGHLGKPALRARFTMPVRAESNPAVAAASLLARAAFLRSFDALKNLADGDLYLGASDPRIVPAARRMLREGGLAWLGKFAKLHFKVTDKAQA